MTHPKFTAQEKRVRSLILTPGYTGNSISKTLRLNKNTVYKILSRLVYFGEIRPIPGTKNPIIYEEVTSPTGKYKDNVEYVQSDIPYICPEGSVEAHINGSVIYKIRKVGNFDTIRDNKGLTVGAWKDPIELTRCKKTIGTQFHGYIRAFRQELTFDYRVFTNGTEQFLLFPQRIIADTKTENPDKIKDRFLDRAVFVAEVLKNTEWQLTNPEIHGTLHFPFPDHPLIRHFDKTVDLVDSDVHVDCSHGEPELEIYNTSPDAWKKAQLIADLPNRFFGLEDKVSENKSKIERNTDLIDKITAQINATKSLIKDISDVQISQTEVLAKQLELTSIQIKIGSNLLTRISSTDQQTINSLINSEKTPYQQPSKPDKTQLEGYN